MKTNFHHKGHKEKPKNYKETRKAGRGTASFLKTNYFFMV